LDIRRIHPKCPDSDPLDQWVVSNMFLQQPEEEEDEEEDEGDGKKDDGDDRDHNGYSE
jgi:hypothetical protein